MAIGKPMKRRDILKWSASAGGVSLLAGRPSTASAAVPVPKPTLPQKTDLISATARRLQLIAQQALYLWTESHINLAGVPMGAVVPPGEVPTLEHQLRTTDARHRGGHQLRGLVRHQRRAGVEQPAVAGQSAQPACGRPGQLRQRCRKQRRRAELACGRAHAARQSHEHRGRHRHATQADPLQPCWSAARRAPRPRRWRNTTRSS